MRWAGLIAFISARLVWGGFFVTQMNEVQADDAKSATAVKASAPARGSAAAKKDGKARPAMMVTPEREAAVLTFVQRNHAELAELLGYLKTSQPAEYERALREIFRTTERLATVQERDPLQYELEVAAWTAQSRVQLLAAKLKMGASDELLKQLREELKAQNESKLALLKHERQKASDRVSKLDGDIARFETDRERIIDQQLKLLTRAAAEGRPAKLGAKNAGKSGKKNAASP
jgi:hypothetical protein